MFIFHYASIILPYNMTLVTVLNMFDVFVVTALLDNRKSGGRLPQRIDVVAGP